MSPGESLNPKMTNYDGRNFMLHDKSPRKQKKAGDIVGTYCILPMRHPPSQAVVQEPWGLSSQREGKSW